MNFQQLRYVRETVRQGLNLTEAAHRLFTSQPGISKQIKELEDELGVQIFVRRGKRLVALTEPGKAVVQMVERVLQESENLKQAAKEYALARCSGHASRNAMAEQRPRFAELWSRSRLADFIIRN